MQFQLIVKMPFTLCILSRLQYYEYEYLYIFPSLGDLLIVIAQIVTATQMVVEEKFVTGHNVPALLAVGWEGK